MENKIIQICKAKKKLVIFDVGCFKGVFSRELFKNTFDERMIGST